MSNSIIPADTIDSNGVSYPSVGGHIRNKSVSADKFSDNELAEIKAYLGIV